MTVLGLKDVHKRYGEQPLLQDVSLHVAEGERVGLVGPNGAGKSTLLRILAGAEQPDSGTRTVRRDLRIGYLAQEPEIDPSSTIRAVVQEALSERTGVLQGLEATHEELAHQGLAAKHLDALLARQQRLEARLEALGGHDVEHRLEALVHDLGLPDPDAPCAPLSGGERRRVALARLLLSAPDVLLLDEPTNHLDALVIDWLEDRLLQTSATLVLVTHDRYFLDRIVTRIVEIDRAEMHEYEGGYGEFLVARAARLEREQKVESSRLNTLRRETEWMKRGPPARTTKAKARIKRFDAIVSAAPTAAGATLEFELPFSRHLGDKVVRLREVTKSYDGRVVLRPFDLEVMPRTRLGIVGPNGAGKTTLLKILTQQLVPDAGEVVVGPTVRFATIDQHRSGLDPEKTVLEEVAGKDGHVRIGERVMRAETFLEQFLFPGPKKLARIGDLSGGEKNRVLLAKLLAQGGNVIALDEPTNDLDLTTLRSLEDALNAFPGVVLVVSHDRWFLDRVATRIVHLDGSGVARVHEGDLSALLEKLAAERAAEEARSRADAKAARAEQPAAAPKKKRLSTREQQELERLPAEIQRLEQDVARLDQELADRSSGRRRAAIRTG
jgi:ATP-binding cassette subfamily F protein uup